ncbi:hypothetical protein OAF45_00505 [Candidatus Latescibacteria bacterium]|nr:hypothetical protein [Candidatus Latescibacterota bacterium]
MATTKTTTEKSPKNTSTAVGQKMAPQKEQEKKDSGKAEPQNVQTEETKKADKQPAKERRDHRLITIVSKDESEYLDSFDLSRSSFSRAILMGCRSFIAQAKFKSATEAEIVDALQNKLK